MTVRAEEQRGAWLRDIVASALPGRPGHAEARDRLANRGGAPARGEYRAASTSTMVGFDTPIYLAQQGLFALGNSPAGSFVPLTTKVEDPGYGMVMHLPSIQTETTAGVQSSENSQSGVGEFSPTGQDLTCNLATAAAEVVVSQQFADRVDPMVEQAIAAQLSEGLASAVDYEVLQFVLANAGSVTNSAAGTAPGDVAASFISDISKASAQSITQTGQRIVPTHLFLPGLTGLWLLGSTDGSLRALFQPSPAGQYKEAQVGTTGADQVGHTGYKAGLTDVFLDDNLPASGANAQLLVANPADVYCLVSKPVVTAIPEALAEDLSVVVRAYCYVGAIVAHPKSAQVVTGSRYPASPVFSQL